MAIVNEEELDFTSPCVRANHDTGPCNGLPRKTCPGYAEWLAVSCLLNFGIDVQNCSACATQAFTGHIAVPHETWCGR